MTLTDKEKIREARRQIHELFANISETKEIWIDESVNHKAFNTPKQFSILLEKAIFLGTVITDLENIKKILRKLKNQVESGEKRIVSIEAN